MPYSKLPAVLLILLFAVAGCGGGDDGGTPTDPSGPNAGGAGTCRELASEYVTADTASGFSNTTTSSCNFNTATRQVTCTFRYSNSVGASGNGTTVITYASVADLVDEVAVVAPRTYALATTSSQIGTNGSFVSSSTQAFDGSRRLSQVNGVSAAGSSTTRYSAWDGSGRPTVGTDVGPGFNNTLAIAYDNTARTKTTVVNGGLVTTTETFDANGNPIRHVTVGGVTSVTTINQTQRICK